MIFFFRNQLVTASGSGEDSQQTNLFKKRLGEHISTWKQLKGLREVNSPEDPQTWQWKQGFWEDEFSLQEGDFLPSMPSTSPWVRTDRARSMHSGSSSQGSMKPPNCPNESFKLLWVKFSFYMANAPPFGFPKWTNCGVLVGVQVLVSLSPVLLQTFWVTASRVF